MDSSSSCCVFNVEEEVVIIRNGWTPKKEGTKKVLMLFAVLVPCVVLVLCMVLLLCVGVICGDQLCLRLSVVRGTCLCDPLVCRWTNVLCHNS